MQTLFKNLKNDWKELNYEICIFLYLVIRSFLFMPIKMISWVATYYACNYSHGFIARGLIGSIFKFITNGDISSINAHSFVIATNYILIILASILFGKIIRSFKDSKKRKLAIILVVLYLFMPFSICYLFDSSNFGRYDVYLYIITIVQILMLYNKKPTFFKLFLCGILSSICVMIHEAYALFVFPIFFVVLLYLLYKNKFKKELIIGSILILVMTLIPTVYFNFFSTINIENSKDYVAQLRQSTDLRINDYCIEYEYYKHTVSEQKYFVDKYLFHNVIGLLVTLFILLIPVNIVLIKFIKNALKENKGSTFNYIIILMLLSTIVFIPLFITTSDWGRWLAALYNSIVTMGVIILIENDGKVFDEIYKKEKDDYGKRADIFLLMSAMLYFALLGTFKTASIFNWLYSLVSTIKKMIYIE